MTDLTKVHEFVKEKCGGFAQDEVFLNIENNDMEIIHGSDWTHWEGQLVTLGFRKLPCKFEERLLNYSSIKWLTHWDFKKQSKAAQIHVAKLLGFKTKK